MFRRLPLHLVLSLAAVHVVAFGLVARVASGGASAFALGTLTGATVLAFGATAALCGRTWGIGLVLAAASAFLTAGVLQLDGSFVYAVAAVAALPFVFAAKYMARFHRGATVLFAALASIVGSAASLSHLVVP